MRIKKRHLFFMLVTSPIIFGIILFGKEWHSVGKIIEASPLNENHDIYVPDALQVIAEQYILKLVFPETRAQAMRLADFLARDMHLFENSKGYLNWNLTRSLLARRIDASFQENFVTHSWLSNVYLGNKEYGIETVSQSMFDKPVSKLSVTELAALAALVESPSYRSNPDAWKIRQSILLERHTLTSK